MDINAAAPAPIDARAVTREALARSALLVGRARRGDRPPAGQNHHFGQGFGGAGSHRRLSHAGGALRLRAASRADRGRHGLEGHRRLLGGARRAVAGWHWRHDPRFADPRARRRPHAGGAGGAGNPADHGLSHLRAAGRRLPGLRPHHIDRVSGTGARHSVPYSRAHGRLAQRNIRASRRSMSR